MGVLGFLETGKFLGFELDWQVDLSFKKCVETRRALQRSLK